MSTRWTEEEYAAYIARHNRSTVQTAHMEPVARYESVGTKASKGLDTQFCVRCTTRGRRLGDVDGRSCKAVLDAFTKAGIWPDDKFPIVKEVSFTQEIAEADETIIEVHEC